MSSVGFNGHMGFYAVGDGHIRAPVLMVVVIRPECVTALRQGKGGCAGGVGILMAARVGAGVAEQINPDVIIGFQIIIRAALSVDLLNDVRNRTTDSKLKIRLWRNLPLALPK